MKTVWITGASSGIGEALCVSFAKRGYCVVAVARRGELLASLISSLPLVNARNVPGERPVHHRSLTVDVGDHSALISAAQRDISAHGLPDIVIANAGISKGTLVDYPEDYGNFAAILSTNVSAMFSTFAAFAGAMRQRGSGTLVGISSVAGVRGLPGSEAYSASKAAATSLCESVRVEMRGSGVKVVTIAPGFIKTPMTAKNPYSMPFLMPVEQFAERAADAIEAGTSYKVIPWQMAGVAKLLRLLPNWLYDRAMAKSGRKPR